MLVSERIRQRATSHLSNDAAEGVVQSLPDTVGEICELTHAAV